MKKYLSLVLAAAMALSLAACGGTADTGAADSADTGDAATDTADTGDAADAGDVAPAGDGAATGTLKIGGIGPLTGPAAEYGVATMQGAELAVNEINALGGMQMELDFQDDTGDAESAVNAYNQLKDWASVIYGCTTTQPCINVASETFADRFFQLTPSASSPDVLDGRDNVFMACFSDPAQGVAIADYLIDNNVGTTYGILYNNADAYSSGIRDGIVARMQEKGIEIAAEATYAEDTNADFSSHVATMQDAGVDCVIMTGYYTPAYNFILQANNAGYNPAYIGGDGMDGILGIEGMDQTLVEGLMLLSPFDAGAADNEAFVSAYEAAYGNTPNQFAADGYDCMYALYAACNKAGIDADSVSHEDLCETLISTFRADDFSVDGTTGKGMVWTETGEVNKSPAIFRIEGGSYTKLA